MLVKNRNIKIKITVRNCNMYILGCRNLCTA